MRSIVSVCLLISVYLPVCAQHKSYWDSLENFQKNYVETHEIVKGPDRKYFHFYKIDPKYRVVARFEKLSDTSGFIMKTSGPRKTTYFRYGLLYFTINKSAFHLTIYQSQRLLEDSVYHNYLFVPFTDITSGEKSYAGGRYLDFFTGDIKNNYLTLDFNKAYNPYCAYATGFSCPIPPAENNLSTAIEAGEMEFSKKH